MKGLFLIFSLVYSLVYSYTFFKSKNLHELIICSEVDKLTGKCNVNIHNNYDSGRTHFNETSFLYTLNIVEGGLWLREEFFCTEFNGLEEIKCTRIIPV